MNPTKTDLLREVYAAYNRQDGDALLALVSERVDWPDGGARLHGKEELRAYWTRQWTKTRTHDEPMEITDLAPDRSVVGIRQVVRALDGAVLSRGAFEHTYHFEGGLILRLDIRQVPGNPPEAGKGAEEIPAAVPACAPDERRFFDGEASTRAAANHPDPLP